MKKSYKKLIIFDIILAIILLLNSFILNILGNYLYMDILLVILLIIFKFVFGFEKDRHRYIKDIIINISIIYLASFIIYYIFGIFIGFVRTDNYFTFYGMRVFIIPYIVMIILREYLRGQMLNKAENSKLLTIVTCIMFILLDFSNRFNVSSLNTNYSKFIFLALTLLPIISNNVVCTYIARKVGYKPNILWMLVAGLYEPLLPFIPDVGLYISSLIRFLFPFVLMYNVYSFFEKRAKDIPISYIKKRRYVEIPLLALFIFILAYFVSGFFRYYAIAIATGSMRPNLKVGDVAIVDQHFDYKNLKVGEVIAYKYEGVIIAHRLCDIAVINDDYYFYTKGDANEAKDNYIIYPDTIVGTVKKKIPYIGLPTVWLNQLFE